MVFSDLISVIVPVYKTEKYLNRCVDSILNSTHKNIEILLIDDGSPDQSPNICDEYSRKDKRVRTIHKMNGGASSARNVGIKAAKGDYITFVDSDDWISPLLLEVLLLTIHYSKSDISICQCVYEENMEDPLNNYCSAHEFVEHNIATYDTEESVKCMVNERIFEGAVWGKLVRTKLFDDILFPTDVTVGEDMVVSVQLMIKSKGVSVYPFKGYHYYQRTDSAIHVQSIKPNWTIQKSCKLMCDFIKKELPEVLPYYDRFSIEQDVVLAMRLHKNNMLSVYNVQLIKEDIKTHLSKESYQLLSIGNKLRTVALFLGVIPFVLYNQLHRLIR